MVVKKSHIEYVPQTEIAVGIVPQFYASEIFYLSEIFYCVKVIQQYYIVITRISNSNKNANYC